MSNDKRRTKQLQLQIQTITRKEKKTRFKKGKVTCCFNRYCKIRALTPEQSNVLASNINIFYEYSPTLKHVSTTYFSHRGRASE